MYLALRPPWGRGTTSAPADAGVVAISPDAGAPAAPAKKKKRRAPGTTGVAPAGVSGAPDEYEETEPIAPLTEADRRLEWRGDDATLPATRLDMGGGGGGEARPLDDAEIQTTLSSQSGALRECVVRGATGTDLRATITAKLVVDGGGRVTKVRLQAPRYLFEHGLLPCAQRATGRMRFPSTGAPTLVTFPITLS